MHDNQASFFALPNWPHGVRSFSAGGAEKGAFTFPFYHGMIVP